MVMNYLSPRKMTTHQMEILQKLEMIGNLESVVTEQKIRIEKLRTTYETLKAEHVQLKEVSLIYISLRLINYYIRIGILECNSL